MEDNGAHSYTEGSEEAFTSGGLLEWYKALSAKRHIEIVSLKEQLNEQRNKAIDECIWTHHQTALAFYSKGLKATSEEIEAALRKLKSDSK